MPVDDDERAETLRLLEELQAESAQRRRELMQLAADVPAAMSRRSLLRAAARDVRSAPNKGELVGRAGRKIARAPLAAARRIRRRFR